MSARPAGSGEWRRRAQAATAGREFFAVRSVEEALRDFRPAHRTATERVALAEGCGRVPARAIGAPGPLPGFARATVDGYAVRAADTYGASESLPAYLTLLGEVRMGAAPGGAVGAGEAVAIPTGGALPEGADAVVMVEHTQAALPDTVEVLRAVAPGEGIVRADEDAVAGEELVPAGRPLRAGELGLLAAAGVCSLEVHRRPRVAIVSTGDEVVPPETEQLAVGQVRDATAVALAALVARAGGIPSPRGIVPDDPAALARTLRAALADSDLVVVSAGSSVGARDQTAAVVSSLGEIFCHGLALKPGKPTLLADCGGVPLIGLPGNPRSALGVFRLIGMGLVRLIGGVTQTAPAASVRARLAHDLPSAAGRVDMVEVALRDGEALPLLGPSALLSPLARADGYLLVASEVTGLAAGSEVEVLPA